MSGWMIEKKGLPPMWWNGNPKRCGAYAWTSDPLSGILFVGKNDAEYTAMAQGYSLSRVFASEHNFE